MSNTNALSARDRIASLVDENSFGQQETVLRL